jgi:hypothetical protein
MRPANLPEFALLVGSDHRLADNEPLKVILAACERVSGRAEE